jgi:hypothetical protein
LWPERTTCLFSINQNPFLDAAVRGEIFSAAWDKTVYNALLGGSICGMDL